jgi:tRNA1Val (adenine37-N6)-methyltransferase
VSNTYFQFKQFKIEQADCAMKVCTDACLFGAWMVAFLKEQNYTNPLRILDIGTGTGLLSLITAQEINCEIDAIEIEGAAAKQAADNFSAATFNSKININENDIRTWDSNSLYDCILSNPPFFEKDLVSPDPKRNLALHSAALSLHELLDIIDKKLNQEGLAAILLPYQRKEIMIRLALEKNLFMVAYADIKQTSKHPFFRTFLIFSRKKQTPLSEEIIIQDNRVYSDRFKELLKKYYLAF